MSSLDTSLTVDQAVDGVSPSDYTRLLGYPPDRGLEGAVLALADESRSWYRRHGRPWISGREVTICCMDDSEVELAGGEVLSSGALARRLRGAEAEALTVAAVSAGPEVDEHAGGLWKAGRPDEAYFLDRLGAAVAEHLAAACGRALHADSESARLVALPGYSPGYEGWDLSQQIVVHELLTGGDSSPPGPLTVLDSGTLAPRNSLLTVFGMTARHDLAAAAWSRNRCGWCSKSDCDFRHTPEAGVPVVGPIRVR